MKGALRPFPMPCIHASLITGLRSRCLRTSNVPLLIGGCLLRIWSDPSRLAVGVVWATLTLCMPPQSAFSYLLMLHDLCRSPEKGGAHSAPNCTAFVYSFVASLLTHPVSVGAALYCALCN